MDRAVYDRMKEIDGQHWWFVARRRIIASLMNHHVETDRPLRILEVGCGTGSNISLLKRYGSVDALEPDDGARAFATERTGIDVRGGWLPDGVEIADASYDAIVLFDVLEHIPDDAGTLAVLRRKLAPGGKLVVTVPAVPWLWSAHDVAHHHHRRYTAHTLEATARNAGFTVCHRTYFNSLLFPLIIAARVMGNILKRKGGDDAMPHPVVNALLTKILAVERVWVSRLSIPFGVSLALIAKAV